MRDRIDDVSGQVVDGAMRVHSALGPGLLEGVYERCLAHELGMRGLEVRTQVALPISYRGLEVGTAFRLDLLVEGVVVVEVKAVARIAPVHLAQLLSYLRLSDRRVGLLLNFNTVHLRDGIRRLVNQR